MGNDAHSYSCVPTNAVSCLEGCDPFPQFVLRSIEHNRLRFHGIQVIGPVVAGSLAVLGALVVKVALVSLIVVDVPAPARA